MPDGRLLRMYRGLNTKVYEQIRQRANEPPQGTENQAGTSRGGEFHSESEGNEDIALVRSAAPDGSLLEIEIR
jgi:hypothetical protein